MKGGKSWFTRTRKRITVPVLPIVWLRQKPFPLFKAEYAGGYAGVG